MLQYVRCRAPHYYADGNICSRDVTFRNVQQVFQTLLQPETQATHCEQMAPLCFIIHRNIDLLSCHGVDFSDSRLMAFVSNHCGAFFPFFGHIGYFSTEAHSVVLRCPLWYFLRPPWQVWGVCEKGKGAAQLFSICMGANDQAGGFGSDTAV